MFYIYLCILVMFLIWVVNGNVYYYNEDKMLKDDENYILVVLYRIFWDFVYMVFVVRFKQFIFMVKKELFMNCLFGWWIKMCGVFFIDCEKLG